MYIKTSPESRPAKVTESGEENVISNGIPDWVYEGKWRINVFGEKKRVSERV